MQGRDCGGRAGGAAGSAYVRGMTDAADPLPSNDDAPQPQPKTLTPAAERALAEAEARRAAAEARDLAPEHGGPKGPEPTRYGDWEKKGLAIDF